MSFEQFSAISHTASSLLFLVLALYFYRPWRNGIYSGLFVLASVVTAWWNFSLPNSIEQATPSSQFASALHYGLWIAALLSTLLINIRDQRARRYVRPMVGLAFILLLIGGIASPYLLLQTDSTQSFKVLVWSNLLLALLGVIVVEQLFRNTLHRTKQAIGFLCAGALMLFAFDILFYANALLFGKTDLNLNNWRPVANLSAAVCLIFATTRSPHSSSVSMSRNVVFYSASMIVAGIFLFAMAAAAYYVNTFGGNWSSILQTALVTSSVLALLALFTSARWRASLRVFVNKHFFMHKYDYRVEWLKLINILSQPSIGKNEKAIALEAASEVFSANKADLWLRSDNEYRHAASTDELAPPYPSVSADSDLCEVLASEWVFHPYGRTRSSTQHNAALPEWMRDIESVWIIAPLIAQQSLLGFIVLSRNDNSTTLTWEDLDVLKTVGRQLGSYLALHVAAEQLAQSKQFDTYNKLTAFIMHDLKNLIAQQALVVENAKKHKENPAFVEDAIKTIENSVTRMSKLLGKMQQREPSSTRNLKLNAILLESVNKCRDKRPVPSLRLDDTSPWVLGDHDHLVMIFSHVIKNSQEATPSNGFVDVFVSLSQDKVIVRVEDNGQGMNDDFIKNRLFRPFDTTKSSQGMGIGVFQTREYIRSLGGDVDVESAEGIGTTFSITMAVIEEPKQHVG